jgi:Lon protease-like protein
MHNPGKSYAQVGTWLDIHSVEWLQDGRAIVDAVASDRFQIVEPLGLVDGYQMAVVQNLKDDDSNESLSTLLETCRDLYKFFDGIFERTSERLQDQVLHAYGPCPLDFKDYSRDDVYRFSFWVASVFPVAVEDKHRVLCATSIRSRLDLVSGWTLRIQQEWWYKRGGCTLM